MRKMIKRLFYIFLFFLCSSIQVFAQPKREVRAAWITTAYRLDWPQTLANSTAGRMQQQKELIQMLDMLKQANINTVLFQVRGRGDATYNSPWEPYSVGLTGHSNGDPGYDPLQFAIEESHKRGMELHAWIVAIPIGTVSMHNRLGAQSPTRKNPSVFVKHKSYWYLNPGNPDSKYYLGKVVSDIVNRYDVDGVHFDYLRYPDNAPNFPDKKEYNKLAKGQNINQWRRDNITTILSHLYAETKRLKPWVKVSTCPIGKHSDTNRYSAKGWNAYNVVYQDVFKWLEMGIQDQIYPMMYFKGNNFYPFALDWQEQSNGRHIVSGLGIYFLDEREGNWSEEEIQRQLYFVRDNHLAGHAFYRAEFLAKDTKGVYTSLQNIHYKYPALIPPMPWLDTQAPSQPENLELKITEDSVVLHWNESTDNDAINRPKYNIYQSDTYPVDTSDPKNILDTYTIGNTYIYTPILPLLKYRYFAVTAIDRYGNESEATQLEPMHDIETPE